MAVVTGRWLFNETLKPIDVLGSGFYGDGSVTFDSNGETFDSIRSTMVSLYDPTSVFSFGVLETNTYTRVYYAGTKTWVDEAYRTIDFGDGQSIISDEFYDWLTSNATPVGGEPEQPEPDLTNIDLYRKINGQPTKLTLYKKVGGELIPLDEYTKEVKT